MQQQWRRSGTKKDRMKLSLPTKIDGFQEFHPPLNSIVCSSRNHSKVSCVVFESTSWHSRCFPQLKRQFPPPQFKQKPVVLYTGRPALLGLPSFPGYCTSLQHSRLQQAPIPNNLVLICVSVHGGGHVTFHSFPSAI